MHTDAVPVNIPAPAAAPQGPPTRTRRHGAQTQAAPTPTPTSRPRPLRKLMEKLRKVKGRHIAMKALSLLPLVSFAAVFSQTDTPQSFIPDVANVGSADTAWIRSVVVSAMPSVQTDEERATFVEEFDPDIIDWYGGLSFNRADFARSRGVACSASEEFEYEESLQFQTRDALHAFANDGLSRDEHNQCAVYGPDSSKFYMELNAPRWKENIKQGDIRPSLFGDVVTQDNIGSPINKVYPDPHPHPFHAKPDVAPSLYIMKHYFSHPSFNTCLSNSPDPEPDPDPNKGFGQL